jgi:hypothetical protein
MSRGRARRLSPWDTAVAETVARRTRYRLRKVSSSPFIYVRDLRAPPGAVKEWSLAPLERGEPAHVRQVADKILALAEKPWPIEAGGPRRLQWGEVVALCEADWDERLKSSSSQQYRSMLRQLVRRGIPCTAEGLRAWALERTPGERPFQWRLDLLGQLRRHLPAEVLPEAVLLELRGQARRGRPGRASGLEGIRGIPTRAEAEDYLDALNSRFSLERWCLAMQFCYGLRNHELWWCEAITAEAPGITAGWLLVPGWWRTKSREEHWVWPLFPGWIERYGLAAQQGKAQEELHRRSCPKVVSCRDKSTDWEPGDPADPGLCVNNHRLGTWVTRRLRDYLPPWFARVPDTDGRYQRRDRPQAITPYDLRHAWAVTVATDPAWRHVSDEEAARAMGHSLDVHRRRYQRWIGAAQRRDRAMAAVRLPVE